MSAGSFDLSLVPGERYDVYLDLLDDTGAPIPLSGWTVIAQVLADWSVVGISTGDTPEIDLVQEPGGTLGRVQLSLGADLTGTFLAPLSGSPGLVWRLDMVDNADTDNIVPVLKGAVLLEAPW